MSAHKVSLLAEWYQKDYTKHREEAVKAKNHIIQHNLSWEDARNIKNILLSDDVN